MMSHVIHPTARPNRRIQYAFFKGLTSTRIEIRDQDFLEGSIEDEVDDILLMVADTLRWPTRRIELYVKLKPKGRRKYTLLKMLNPRSNTADVPWKDAQQSEPYRREIYVVKLPVQNEFSDPEQCLCQYKGYCCRYGRAQACRDKHQMLSTTEHGTFDKLLFLSGRTDIKTRRAKAIIGCSACGQKSACILGICNHQCCRSEGLDPMIYLYLQQVSRELQPLGNEGIDQDVRRDWVDVFNTYGEEEYKMYERLTQMIRDSGRLNQQHYLWTLLHDTWWELID